MIENDNINAAKVICVSTGTKCIDGDYMSLVGRTLNDSHAEIVARRCLIDFFYNQLDLPQTPVIKICSTVFNSTYI